MIPIVLSQDSEAAALDLLSVHISVHYHSTAPQFTAGALWGWLEARRPAGWGAATRGADGDTGGGRRRRRAGARVM